MWTDLEILIARRFIGNVSAEEIVDWALEALNKDIDSVNIRTLAALKYTKPIDRVEVDYYFQKCIKDLGYFIPSEEESLMRYVEIYCHKIINQAVTPKRGLDEIYKVILYARYPQELKAFLYVSDGLHPYNFSDLADEDLVFHIVQESTNFITRRKAALNTTDKSA